MAIVTEEFRKNIEQNIFKVAKVINDYELVINVGSNKGLIEGSRFIVYSLGNEIFDPDTHESLGKLEIIKGTGKVTHVQEKMAIIKTIGTINPKIAKKTIKETPYYNYFNDYCNDALRVFRNNINIAKTITEEPSPSLKPFNNPQVGDFVKYIP